MQHIGYIQLIEIYIYINFMKLYFATIMNTNKCLFKIFLLLFLTFSGIFFSVK